MIADIQKDISDRFHRVEARALGGKSIIISFPNVTDKKFVSDDKEWILSLPRHLWSMNLFSLIGGKFGDFILASMDTVNKSRFDVAKILIKFSNSERINEKLMISLGNESFACSSMVHESSINSVEELNENISKLNVSISNDLPSGKSEKSLHTLNLKKYIRNLLSKYNPDVVCLLETKLEGVRSNDILKIWNEIDLGWISSDAQGRSGGILVIWKKENFQLQSSEFND
ncbi:hypothetical protein ACFE04_028986 [Oxalis oulophora]